jgi:hypothetical protein
MSEKHNQDEIITLSKEAKKRTYVIKTIICFMQDDADTPLSTATQNYLTDLIQDFEATHSIW